MSRFFIDRPIFAWVIAIIIMMAGGLAALDMPIELYPDIAPPTVSINANYPGADARTIEESVTQVIEQAMTGLDGLRYISSSSNGQGEASVGLTFTAGINPDMAQVQVQNKLQQALRQLPAPVQAQGVSVNKSGSGFLVIYSFWVEDGTMSPIDVADYLRSTIADPIARLNGVGNVRIFGSPYAMRIWLDPYKLARFNLMPGDVRAALLAQNTQVSAGQLGGLPSVAGQQITATITAQSRLRTADEFRDVTLRVNPDGSAVRVGDVARVELGAEDYAFSVRKDGRPASGFAVSLSSGANALETAELVAQRLGQLAPSLPKSLKYQLVFDTAKFVRDSMREVVLTLFEAMLLVVAIMFLFLENWRATLVPAIAVPVVLLGTLGVLAAAGYSINTLTLFGMVLAIGLLVDDAIVVVENVERIMRDEGLTPREATRKSMDQITGALLGIALVLSAVLLPMAFIGGSTGIIYRQFSITICVAMGLSVLVALILSPALCASVLRAEDVVHSADRRGFFGRFERLFQRYAGRYQRMVGRLLPRQRAVLAAFALVLALVALLYWRLPTGFLPSEDRSAVVVNVRLPPGATQQRTIAAQDELRPILERERVAINALFSVVGFSFGPGGQNSGMFMMRLKDQSVRDAAHASAAIAERVNKAARGIRGANVFATLPPTIQGLGTGEGFDLELQDLGGLGPEALAQAREQFLQLAGSNPLLAQVRAQGQPEQPQFHLTVDQVKARALGLSIGDINDTLSAALGGNYVNDFINKNRVKRVYLQADAPFRMQPDDVNRWFVRNGAGEMVPLSAVTRGDWTFGPQVRERFNGASAIAIAGQGAPGVSSGTAMQEAAKIVAQLPEGIGYSWSGASAEEATSGAQLPVLYAISIVFVFLCLAALYESWTIPFAVMLVVPLGLAGALAAASLRGQQNDVLFQVALLTSVGLSAKNAILIVEFASKLHHDGLGLIEATLEAVRIRLRPIIMTSLAFMLGVLPLVVARGAGAAGRQAIGTGVFGGMLTATALGIFFVPVFFVVVQKLFGRRASRPGAAPAA